MKIRLDILRKDPPENGNDKPSYWQSFDCEYDESDKTVSVATLIEELNSRLELKDVNGEFARPIVWDRSCLQKKCGACAMVINGKPCLACDSRIENLVSGEAYVTDNGNSSMKSPGKNTGNYSAKNFEEDNEMSSANDAGKHGGKDSVKDDRKVPVIKIEPLRKFPVIIDLMVDRTIMMENLKTMNAWLREDTHQNENQASIAYEASRCMQCGLCLEICPNFYAGGYFFGMASIIPMSRLLAEVPIKEWPEEDRKTLKNNYSKHGYNGCGKSLACKDICPAGINTEDLMARSNAAAVWGRPFVK